MCEETKPRETTSQGLRLMRVGLEEMARVEGGVACQAGALPGNSRQFTIVSNVLRAMQDAAKNAINNIR